MNEKRTHSVSRRIFESLLRGEATSKEYVAALRLESTAGQRRVECRFRACACDADDLSPDVSEWFATREEAEAYVPFLRDEADPPYDRIWLERRTVSAPVCVKVIKR